MQKWTHCSVSSCAAYSQLPGTYLGCYRSKRAYPKLSNSLISVVLLQHPIEATPWPVLNFPNSSTYSRIGQCDHQLHLH